MFSARSIRFYTSRLRACLAVAIASRAMCSADSLLAREISRRSLEHTPPAPFHPPLHALWWVAVLAFPAASRDSSSSTHRFIASQPTFRGIRCNRRWVLSSFEPCLCVFGWNSPHTKSQATPLLRWLRTILPYMEMDARRGTPTTHTHSIYHLVCTHWMGLIVCARMQCCHHGHCYHTQYSIVIWWVFWFTDYCFVVYFWFRSRISRIYNMRHDEWFVLIRSILLF